MPRRLDTRAEDFENQFALLIGPRETEEDVARVVQAIIADVRARGDAALIELSRRFDRVDLNQVNLRVSEEEIAAAERDCPDNVRNALRIAAARIRGYHERQLPKDETFTDSIGANLGWRWRPLSSVGLYVPGGTASYPSSVLMNAVPA